MKSTISNTIIARREPDIAATDHWNAADASKFRLLFNRHFESLCMLACRYTGEYQVAQDLVQDFFIRIWQKGEDLVIAGSFEAYARKSIYHASVDYLRKYRPEQLSEEVTQISQLKEENWRVREEQVIQALQRLPAKCREIFLLIVVHQKSYREVAELQGISINTVKVQMTRAYKFLRKSVQHELPAPVMEMMLTLLLMYYAVQAAPAAGLLQ